MVSCWAPSIHPADVGNTISRNSSTPKTWRKQKESTINPRGERGLAELEGVNFRFYVLREVSVLRSAADEKLFEGSKQWQWQWQHQQSHEAVGRVRL